MALHRIITLIIFAYCLVSVSAQQVVQKALSLSEYEMVIEGELFLNTSIKTPEGNTEYQIVAPIELVFNRNDLKILKNNPHEYISLFKISEPTMKLIIRGKNEASSDKKIMKGSETSAYRDGDVVINKQANGFCSNNIEVDLIIDDFRRQVEHNGKNLKFQLFIKCESTIGHQKNVTGKIRINDFVINDGVFLDVNIPYPYIYPDDITNEMTNNDQLMQSFTQHYFKNLPSIDFNELASFLISPGGTGEFNFDGFWGSNNGQYRLSYNGSFRLKTGSVRKH